MVRTFNMMVVTIGIFQIHPDIVTLVVSYTQNFRFHDKVLRSVFSKVVFAMFGVEYVY